ncbi:sensor histidine kinase [Methylobacterium sp. J-092]|uniref:sensor histidine kinase n=1 Tax=Methylobacterium sp. J-092 TaxID=2836667 RepID=UPI001FB93C16|nr:HAMP domain-containing sensor histidine kinase [Methylobacterium sp. J-092]MCJ2009595.1 HAMP domain-containing histidine kinase [Methylobacterium sp. J-092]
MDASSLLGPLGDTSVGMGSVPPGAQTSPLYSRWLARIETFHRFVDWFIPGCMANEKARRKQARLFLLSHLLGPFLGNGTAILLSFAEPDPGFEVIVVLIAISGFWLFPFLLRRFGRLEALALISIENLTFCVLWVTYFYGGAASPFLPWTITIPLLAFFYVGNSPALKRAIFALLAGNATAFYLVCHYVGMPKQEISVEAMQRLGILSTAAIGLYVTMMALYYARALASQTELEETMREYAMNASALKHAAWEAESESAAKIDFLAKMSHELRTPLNAIIGYSQMLLEEEEDAPDAESVQDLRRIHISGQNLYKLVNKILDIAKIDAGKAELFNEYFDPNGTIECILDDVGALARENGNGIEFRPAPGAPILGDQHKFQAALTEVVENAVKFTRDGRILVSCSYREGDGPPAFHVNVTDSGIGIDPMYLPTLFEQYAVGDEHTSTKYGGTGLGLALARKMCRLMDGDISVRTRVGEGSEFRLTFPIRPRWASPGDYVGIGTVPHPVTELEQGA